MTFGGFTYKKCIVNRGGFWFGVLFIILMLSKLQLWLVNSPNLTMCCNETSFVVVGNVIERSDYPNCSMIVVGNVS